uniref:Protein kinase domain-containing protein n=1 Tax=Oryza meridionalis TaxID=40149 RepID=A0A0E0EXP3_9ORYZ
MEGSTSKHDSLVQKHVDFGILENNIQDPTATPMYLPMEFLKTITCDFSKEQELGRGGYGVVYKGILSNGKMIAVKKLLEIHILEDDKFQKEVTFLMDLKHPNIVRFIGYCAESRWEALQLDGKKYVMVEMPRRLLCFEYLHNKSLDKYISVKNWRDWLERTVGCASMETCCQQVYRCMVIGLACVDPDPKKRPSAWVVIQMLNETECKNRSHVGQALQMFTMKSAYLLDDLTIARTGPSTSNTAKQVIAATYVDSILGARSSTSNTESTVAMSCVPARRSMIEIMAFGVAKILVRGSNMMKSDGAASGERKIGILAFEVANTIVSGSNLMKSLSEESMSHLNEVVLQSEGVHTLISEQYYQLLIIHQADIRLELLYKSREYIILKSELACSKEEAVSAMQYLLKRAQYTMELYKEMCLLDKFEQGKTTVIVQKLVDTVLLIYLEINNAFLHTDEDHYVEAVGNLGETLGSTGLALQYSKVILQIKTLTSEEEVRAEMNRMLQWLVPIAESTRLYYNDGASEQAMNRMEDADDVQDFRCNIIRSRWNNSADSRVSKIGTLFYANKERADSHILCLVKALHQLVCYERERQLTNMRLDIELHRPRAFRTRPS